MCLPRDCPLSDGGTRSQKEVCSRCNYRKGEKQRKQVNIAHHLETSQSEIESRILRSDAYVSSNPGVSTKTTCRLLTGSQNLIASTSDVRDFNPWPIPVVSRPLTEHMNYRGCE